MASASPAVERGRTAARGIRAPAKKPDAIVERLNQEIVHFINSAATKQHLLSMRTRHVGSSPEEFAALIKTEISRVAKRIRDTGIAAG